MATAKCTECNDKMILRSRKYNGYALIETWRCTKCGCKSRKVYFISL